MAAPRRENESTNARRPTVEHTDAVEPHQMANELTDDPTVQATASTSRTFSPKPDGRPPNRTQRDIGRLMMMIVGAVIVLALLIAAAITRQWLMLGLAALVLVPFMILLLMPVWLASTTKIAQDHAAQRGNRGDAADDSSDRHAAISSPHRR